MANFSDESLKFLDNMAQSPMTITTSLGEPPEGARPTHKAVPTWASVRWLIDDVREAREQVATLIRERDSWKLQHESCQDALKETITENSANHDRAETAERERDEARAALREQNEARRRVRQDFAFCLDHPDSALADEYRRILAEIEAEGIALAATEQQS